MSDKDAFYYADEVIFRPNQGWGLVASETNHDWQVGSLS